MGIKVEFNPDLALRNISEFKEGKKTKEECVPEKLVAGEVYDFLKNGQRNFWLEGEMPLLETDGNENLSRPLASIVMVEVIQFAEDGKLKTKGKYKVVEVFDDEKVHFDGFSKI